MDILINSSNIVIAMGDIEFGVFDEPFNKWKVELNGQMYYIIDNQYECVDVKDNLIPNDNIINKYCYTKEEGFYLNLNYVEPINEKEEMKRLIQENLDLKAQLDKVQEVLDYLVMQ